MNLRYTDQAVADLEYAVGWYEQQRKGLRFEFLDCIEAALKGILRMPELYLILYENFHRCIIRRFPFSIFYTIEKHTIVIHAIFDNRQDPVKLP